MKPKTGPPPNRPRGPAGPAIPPRRVAPEVVAAALPGPARDRLAAGEVLVVTTGQQPGLFTGPLYPGYKALSAIALARRPQRGGRGARAGGVGGGWGGPDRRPAEPHGR